MKGTALESEVEKYVREEAEKRARSLEGIEREELCAIYDSFTQRFVSDNSNIWTANAIFTPAAFAALAVHFTVNNQNLLEFGSLFIASIGLALASLVIAEKHKALQNGSLIEMRAVERVLANCGDNILGLHHVPSSNPVERMAKEFGIGRARRSLIVFLLLSWVVALASFLAR